MLSINHVFLCLICSPVYLYCSPVILCCHFNVIFNFAIKVRGLACHKTRFNPPLLFPFKSVLYQVRKMAIVIILFVSVFSYFWDKTWHGTCLSHIHVFGFDVIFVILVVYCLLLGPFLCAVAFRCCVVVLLLYLMRFPQFWFVAPILFFVHGFMSFEQRYTTVAFIYPCICLIFYLLWIWQIIHVE